MTEAKRKALSNMTCSRCEGKGWAWEYAHPLVGFDMKWRRCHCKLGKTKPKPKGVPNED